MNLRPRFFILNAVILLAGFFITLTVFFNIADRTVHKWGVELASNQLLYDKSRAVQSLIREITLAKQMAKSNTIIYWAKHQDDPKAKAAGIAEMENFRKQFKEGTYFIAFKDSGKYYYNNKNQTKSYDPYKYNLHPDKPSDRWFYNVINEGNDFHINVNVDAYLKVTKLWVDVVMRDGGKTLGVLGTGLDLDTFIKNFTKGKGNQDGITSLFIDHDGAIQVYFDKKYIDFASITKQSGHHNSVYGLFREKDDCTFLTDSINSLPDMSYDKVLSKYVEVNGKRYLAGISYIPELDWYEITLHDLNSLMQVTDLYGIALAFLLTLLISIVLYYFALNKFVIRPIHILEDAIKKLKSSDYSGASGLSSHGEMGRLMEHFREMSSSVRETRENLEKKVCERTMELDRLVKIDPMTELLNRRGMNEILSAELKRAGRSGRHTGLLWIDIDRFKEINDSYGHSVGDDVIVAVAAIIRHAVREYDHVARWGGDEFIVLMPECNHESLRVCGERILTSVANKEISVGGTKDIVKISVSIGGYVSSGESEDFMLNKADNAMYEAKENGRGRIVIF